MRTLRWNVSYFHIGICVDLQDEEKLRGNADRIIEYYIYLFR